MSHFCGSLRLIFIALLLIVFEVEKCRSAKILCLFPTPSYSHQQPMLALAYSLAAKGHNMTIITPNPSKDPIDNVREIDISSLYVDWMALQQTGTVSLQKRSDAMEIVSHMCAFLSLLIDRIVDKPQVLDLIKEVNGTKYDLILYESLLYSALLGFAEITGKPPIIGLTTVNPFTFMDDQMGNPTSSSFIPQVMLPHSDKMTMYQRFYNFYVEMYIRYTTETCIIPYQQIQLQRLFGDVSRTASQLEYEKSLFILSTDLATGYPKPVQPNTIFVGPMHLKKPDPLPKDIKDWMDSAEDGVIYFSLGSNMKGTSVPVEIREMFIKAFQQFPKMKVLWKWEGDTDLPGRPANVLAKKWLPQQSILAHPKCSLFITQVGLQSLQETINNKVPILGVPMFGDQNYNMHKLIKEGAGLTLEFNTISYESIYENIRTILTNPSFRENMVRLWKISNDKPMPAIETAIWWVEYVLRHDGAPHLRPASLQLSWYQYYMLDVFGSIIAVILVVIYSLYFFITRFLLSHNVKLKTN